MVLARSRRRSNRPRNLHVVMVHDSHDLGGLEAVMSDLVRHLRDEIRVTVLARGYEGTPWTSPEAFVTTIRSLGVEIRRPRTGRSRFAVVRRARECTSTWRVFRALRPDLAHIHTASVEGARLQTVLARLAGISHVIRTEHNSPTAYSRKPFDSRSRRWADRLTERVVTVSLHDALEQVEIVGRDRAFVTCIHNGIEVGSEPPSRGDADPVTVLNIGRLSTQKDQLTLVRSMDLVVAERPRTRLVIAGEGPVRPQLEQLIDDLSLSESVELVGWSDDIERLIASADIGVMTSVHEGLSLSLLEFMAGALPTVVTDHPGLTEAAVDGLTSIVVPIGAPRATADAILRLVDDAELRRSLGVAGRERVATDFSIDRHVADVIRLYRDLAGVE